MFQKLSQTLHIIGYDTYTMELWLFDTVQATGQNEN